MSQAMRRERTRRRLSLSVRLSLLVLFAALLPLAAVVGITNYFARGALVQQSRTSLSTDATAKATLIDTYLRERMLDGEALASLPTAPPLLICATVEQPPANLACNAQRALYTGSMQRALAVGVVRDSNYAFWSIYDARGALLMSSNTDAAKAVSIPKADLAAVVQGGTQRVSDVAYDPQSQQAFIRIYTPITPAAGQKQPVLGFLQATLRLGFIWQVVAGEQGANGAGSSAFITDQNGIRIADVNSATRFTAVRPLDAAVTQQIVAEKRFGTDVAPTVASLPDVAGSLAAPEKEALFQGIATQGSTVKYQFDRLRLTTVPWTYFVLSPVSTVTSVADVQLRTSLLAAAIVAILAILIGLFIGRRTTAPVRSSVVELEGAAISLQSLASRQQSSAGEQQWVVDACRTGLESVRYLSDAMHQAAQRIVEASNWFGEYWDRLTEEQARRTVQHLLELAGYVDEAARRQQASSDRLGKAITVTMQVSDQLVTGATAATQSAEQLEQVVADLQRVVGGRVSPALEMPAQDEEPEPVMAGGPRRMLPAPARLEVPGPLSPAGRARSLPQSPSTWGGGAWGEQSGGLQDGYGNGYGGATSQGGYGGGYGGATGQGGYGGAYDGSYGTQGGYGGQYGSAEGEYGQPRRSGAGANGSNGSQVGYGNSTNDPWGSQR